MKKTFIFIAGLPASGKDTVANILEKNGFYIMTYSKEILKPIIENPKETLEQFFKQTIGFISNERLEKIVNYIEELKEKQVGRDLYISVAMYLNDVIKELTDGEYRHFSLFANRRYQNKSKIAIAGFRIKEEINILEKVFPKTKIVTILVKADDSLRYKWIQQRDKIDIKTIQKNEEYERKETYDRLIKEFKFDYIIENNSTLDDLEEKVTQILIKKLQ